jgi:hypothetical protein
MKKILTITLIAIFFVSCDKDNNPEISITHFKGGLLVLNEGLKGQNNSSITYYDFETGSVSQDVFFTQNGRRLGDIANDMLIYDEKIYITVGFSNTIEVTDLELKSIKQIQLENNREPHGLAAHNGKIYFTCFDGHLARLDTATFNVDYIKVGSNPENIVISKGFAYITNSGGLNFMIGTDPDSTVSVIDLTTFTEVEKIVVGLNPFAIGVDKNGDVIVSTRGNYSDIPYGLHRINTTTNTYEKQFTQDITPADFVMKGNTVFYYDFDWGTFTGKYVEFNTTTETITRPNFISDPSLIGNPYAININKETDDIYLSDADWMGPGKVFGFDKTGNKRFEFLVGLWPKKIVVLQKIATK